jgi:DNA-binding MarR family transcriptional regulator
MITSALKKGFAEAGVEHASPAYLGVLMALWQDEGLQVVDLGRRAGLEPSTMTGLLDRMERDGLVERKDDPKDRRAQLIHLTEDGRRIRPAVLNVVDRIIGRVFGDVSDKDLSVTKGVLRRILSGLREGDER